MNAAVTLEQIISFLLETPLFKDLNPVELSDVVRIVQLQNVRDGQPVFREGAEGDAWYVLFRGQLEVTKENAARIARRIAVLEPHACFGEMAVLDGSPRSASVRALGDAAVFRFPRGPFNELLRQNNVAAYKLVLEMAKLLSHRQRALTQRLSESPADVASRHEEIRRDIAALLDDLTVSE